MQMSNKGFFEVEEIGMDDRSPSVVFLKGSKGRFLGKEELIGTLFFQGEDQKEMNSLLKGDGGPRAQFARTVLRLANHPIKEMKIVRIARKKGGKAVVTSDLKFMDGSSIVEATPNTLLYGLVCNGTKIYSHTNLHMEESRMKIFDRIKYKNIEDIELKERPVVPVNENDYVKLEFDRILMHWFTPSVALDSIFYKKGSNKYRLPPFMNKVILEKAMKDEGKDPSRVLDNLSSPSGQEDYMSVIYHVMRRANIGVDSIYVDGNLRQSNNIFRYEPRSAIVVLEKDGEKIVTPVPWEQAISLSYLNSKGIHIKKPASKDSKKLAYVA